MIHRNMEVPSGKEQMVLQGDAIEEPFLVPQRTFQTRVLQRTISLKSSSKNLYMFLKEL